MSHTREARSNKQGIKNLNKECFDLFGKSALYPKHLSQIINRNKTGSSKRQPGHGKKRSETKGDEDFVFGQRIDVIYCLVKLGPDAKFNKLRVKKKKEKAFVTR